MLARRTIALILLMPTIACVSTRIELEPILAAEFTPTIAEQDLWRAASEYHAGLEKAERIIEDEELRSYLQSNLDKLLRIAKIPAGSSRVVIVKDPHNECVYAPQWTRVYPFGDAREDGKRSATDDPPWPRDCSFPVPPWTEGKALSERQRTNRILNRIAVGILFLPLGLSAVALDDLADESLKAILEPQVAGYSRELEAEADRYAFEVMSRAGYAPVESERLFQLLADEAKLLEEEINLSNGYSIRDPYYYARHPDLVERTEFYRQLRLERNTRCLSEADTSRDSCSLGSGEIGAERYMSNIQPLALEVVKVDLKAGRRKSVIRIMERLVEFHPRSADSWSLLGKALGARGWDDSQRDEAVVAFERAVALEPGLASAHRELGLLYRAMGRNGAADKSLRRYVESAPDALDRAIVEDAIGELQ